MRVMISPSVEIEELRAEISWLRNRNLILAQALRELRDQQPQPAPTDAGTQGENENAAL